MRVDQATSLRRLMEKQAKGISLEFQNIVNSLFVPGYSVLSFCVANGEVLSLSALSANLAWEVSRMGYTVCAFDAHEEDINTPFIAGCKVPPLLRKFYHGECDFSDLRVMPQKGIIMMRGLDHIKEFNRWRSGHRQVFLTGMKMMCRNGGTFVFINELNPLFSLVISNVVLVFSPHKDSLLDAYKKVKKIKEVNPAAEVSLVVTGVGVPKEAEEVAYRFNETAEKFLGSACEYLGCILVAKEAIKSIKERVPFVVRYRYSKSSEEIRGIAKKIVSGKYVRAAESRR